MTRSSLEDLKNVATHFPITVSLSDLFARLLDTGAAREGFISFPQEKTGLVQFGTPPTFGAILDSSEFCRGHQVPKRP